VSPAPDADGAVPEPLLGHGPSECLLPEEAVGEPIECPFVEDARWRCVALGSSRQAETVASLFGGRLWPDRDGQADEI
jgi:hypothetical protein